MTNPILLLILILGYVNANNSLNSNNCDYKLNVGPYKINMIHKQYNAGDVCRYVVSSSKGYKCKLQCKLYMRERSNDRFLISRSGDPTLAGAKSYSGSRILNVTSTGNTISMGLLSSQYSRGGSLSCTVSAVQAPEHLRPSTQCRCGDRKIRRIVGGTEAKISEYPMMAGLIENTQSTVYCGGVIISDRYVLTAAHCVFGMSVASLSLVLGVQDVGENIKRRKIRRFIVHENYNRVNFDYDIALVVARQKIICSETVQPACLPYNYRNTNLTGQSVTILGWGLTSPGGIRPNTLRKVDVDIIAQERCRASEGNVTDRQICTFTPGKDSCQYDSGGPLLLTDPRGVISVVGLVSFSNRWCGTAGPAINVRLEPLLDWIADKTKENIKY